MRTETPVHSVRLAIEIEWDPKEHVWTAEVPALNNLSTYGDTYQEAADRCREAILGFLEASDKEGLPLPLAPADTQILLASLTDHPKAP
jgi:predicted RNase H-like HicB family nuclease